MKNYLVIIFISYLFVILFAYWLRFLNFSYLKKHDTDIPSGFEGHIDEELLKKTKEYTLEHSRLDLIESVLNNILLLIFLFGGLLNLYNSWISSLRLPFIVSGTLFFILLSYAGTVLSIPFGLYSTFRIENKYGFRTITCKLWVIDFIKSTLLSTFLMGIVLSVAFWIIHLSPHYWWLGVWGFFLLFSLFIMYISPYIIEPLFHKFSPIGEEGLEERIKELMKKVHIKISKVFKIDASKRSRHTNAYFTGIGRVKRIILYDTLLENMKHDEILAVLAHEAGHWKKKHILKQIIVLEFLSLIGIYISFRILQTDFLVDLFQIKPDTLFAKLVILGFIGSIISFPFTLLSNYISRRFEKEADMFAVKLIKNSESMTRVLLKLSKDNLANLHPHPLYAAFYYSHPPVVQRVKYLRELSH
ncbi:MAG: M48 family metallopeptidase [Nitrospirota bacterium]|nr:M48 family metallopeptidase [Nitrospirota bacterium]MDH5768362.1 M48 family metallopeptidase [Nitrospirota bacterium]